MLRYVGACLVVKQVTVKAEFLAEGEGEDSISSVVNVVTPAP